MLRTSAKREAPPSWRGRGRRPIWLYLLLGAVAVGLVIGAIALGGGEEPGPTAESAPASREPIKVFIPPLATPEPTPTPIPTPEIPDWIQEDLLPINEWSRPGDPMEAVNGIVVHYVGNPGTTGKQNRSYFAYLAETHETYASSNFVIGLEGEIILCVPIGEIAYCSKDRNIDTLSIEVCHPDKTGKFTQASYDSLVKLVRWLMDFYDLDTDDILRHYDVTGKECPLYFVNHKDAWEDFKAEVESSEFEWEYFVADRTESGEEE